MPEDAERPYNAMSDSQRADYIKQLVADIAPDGEWWKSSSGDTFEQVVSVLMSYQVPVPVITTCLQQIKTAMMEEYGE